MIMSDNSNSTDRRPSEYLLFIGAFLGCLIAAGGVLLASPFLAVSGLLLLMFALSCFGLASED
jgi:hypothetical protein